MAKNILVVESPAKSRTLAKFLGKDFDIVSTIGHIVDLPKSKLGVDVDNGFAPDYTVIKGKEKVISELRKAAKKAEKVYLAPDPDREGEAIAWHVANSLKDTKAEFLRITFNEITKSAVKGAIENPRSIDYNLVNAQQARRVLDRLVGYKVSPFLWKTVLLSHRNTGILPLFLPVKPVKSSKRSCSRLMEKLSSRLERVERTKPQLPLKMMLTVFCQS